MSNILCTGVTGQDGSYLSEYLLSLGHKVTGIYRRSSTPSTSNLVNCIGHENFELVCGDITDPAFINSTVEKYKPDEIYSLAAMSFVTNSYSNARYTFDVNTLGVLNILEAVKNYSPKSKVYQASTSEMFGSSISYIENNMRYETNNIKEIPAGITQVFQDETTPMTPVSPYGISKTASYLLCEMYKKAYGLHVCCGILMNHESPRRGKEFVSRKITDFVGRLANKFDYTDINSIKPEPIGDNLLYLGNLNATRDFGHSRDYVEAMYLMMQQDNPDNYVVSTMETHTIRSVCEKAFSVIGLNYEDYVRIDPKFYRPSEVDFLLGDCTKIKFKLGWYPKTSFNSLIEEMVLNDIRLNSGK